MDAATLIQKNIDIERLMNHYDFDKIKPDGVMIRSCCKLHGGDNPTSFVANSESGLWYCHTGDCGGGDIFTLVQKMENISFKESVKFVADLFNVDISNLQIAERTERHVAEMKQWVKAMQSRKKKKLQEYSIPEEIKTVNKYRSFKEETLQHFKLGWVAKVSLQKRGTSVSDAPLQTYTLFNRLVFPIIQDGIQVGISFRRVKPTDVPKWSHQPAQIETAKMLYNYDEVKNSNEIIVCEGVLDVWAFHEIGKNAVATFGAHLTEEQYKMLMRTGADIILAYDGDDAGRGAVRKATEMLKYKVNLYKIDFEDGEDPESITREELLKRYESKRNC